MITYKSELTEAMNLLASDPHFRFIGYNVKYGSLANGTLAAVAKNQLIETPVAENLVAGLAIGYALRGVPVLTWIERFDFMLNAYDAIVNHADKIARISGNEFRGNVIFRTIVGNRKKPLFTGATHVQDFSESLRQMVSFPVVQLKRVEDVVPAYVEARKNLNLHSTVMVEYRELYDEVKA